MSAATFRTVSEMENDSVAISWFGHSCFTLESDGYVAAIDPYENGSVPGLPPLQLSADAVYCSHEHGDHNARARVKQRRSALRPAFSVAELASFHDDCGGKKRGDNTVRIFTCGPLRIVHLGDLGHEPDGRLVESIGTPDAVMVPIGGYYTLDAAQAARTVAALGARVVIPMHYRGASFGFDCLGTLADFTALCPLPVQEYDGALCLTEKTAAQIAVFSLPREN